MVDWDAEFLKYNDATLDNTQWYDTVLQCTHKSGNFKGAILALLDDNENPICVAKDMLGFAGAVGNPRGGVPSLESRFWAAIPKAQVFEQTLSLSGSPLSGAMYAGIDALQGIEYNLSSVISTGDQSAARNLILQYRNVFVASLDALQQIEAASLPGQQTQQVQQAISIQQAPVVQAVQQAMAVFTPTGSGEGDLEQIVAMLQSLYNTLVPEYTYRGLYRYTQNLVIPANKALYEVDIGFKARIFNLDTKFPVTLRINDSNGDQIFLDYQTSPYKLEKIPVGLAFDKFFITNRNTQDIKLTLFAMG